MDFVSPIQTAVGNDVETHHNRLVEIMRHLLSVLPRQAAAGSG